MKLIACAVSLLFFCGCVTTKRHLKEKQEMYQQGVADTIKTFDTCVEEGRKLENRFNSIVKDWGRQKEELKKFREIENDKKTTPKPYSLKSYGDGSTEAKQK